MVSLLCQGKLWKTSLKAKAPLFQTVHNNNIVEEKERIEAILLESACEINENEPSFPWLSGIQQGKFIERLL